MIFNKRVLSFYIIIISSLKLSVGQTDLYQFTHLSSDQGLSHNKVTAIIQDRYGFMWFGTDHGLNRFDGYNMISFYHLMGDSTSLSHNHIETLFEDSQGNLWIGTNGGGLNRFDYQTLKFKHYQTESHLNTSISSNSILCIFENPKGILWIGTRNGLNRFNPSTETFTRYMYEKGSPLGLPSNIIPSVHSNDSTHLWIASYGGGIARLDFTSNTFNIFSQNQPATILDNNVWEIYEDPKGKVWIGSETGALNVYNQNTGKFSYYGYSPIQMKNKGENMVRKMVPGMNDDIWIASASGGLYQLNHTVRYFRVYRHNPTIRESLQSNFLTTVYKSPDHVLWIGFENGGVDRIDLNQKRFYRLTQIIDNTNSLCNNVVNGILQDIEGNYWFATDNGLSVADTSFEKFNHFFEQFGNTKTINHNTVTCLYQAKNGEIWIGTALGGINIYNKKTKKFRYLMHDQKESTSLKSNHIQTICEDFEGNFWIGTQRGGLSFFNSKTQKFEQPFKGEVTQVTNDVTAIIAGADGSVYIATYGGGLVIYQIAGQHTKVFLAHENGASNLTSNQITTLFFDSDSVLWVGTNFGLNQYDPQNETFIRYLKEDGLPGNIVGNILEDQSKNLWISTNNGITKFNKSKKKFTNYYKSDGLQSSQFNYNSAIKNVKGELFFGGKNGVSHFFPDSIRNYQTSPHLNFTGLSVFNQTINVGDTLNQQVLLSKPIYETDTLELTYKESVFTLYFSSHDYTQTENIKYRYRLKSVDSQWMELGSRNFITFHNLPFGNHILEIQTKGSSGEWFPNTKKMTLILLPPFWKTSWFKVALFGLILFGILWLNQLRIKRIRKQKILLEKMVEEKTMDLNEINTILEEKQAELEMQNEEIASQRDLAHEQRKKIEAQNSELELHRKHLEYLIDQRTIELVKAKEDAEKADKLKTAFLANMSHEIRTPMNAILGFVEILDDPGYTDQERTQFKKLIYNSGQNLITLINDIIDIARIESGQIEITFKPFELANLLNDLQLMYEKKALEIGSSIKIHLEPTEKTTFYSDPHRINQVFINLLDNALKFTEIGEISFGYHVRASEILFFVKDTGIGIPEEAQSYIFDRFRKIENSSYKLYRGAGLGLTISKNIVALLGGNIWVESQFGKGTNFYFSLPIKDIPAKE